MTQTLPSPLDSLMSKDIQFIPWENVENYWNNQLNKINLQETQPQALIYPKSIDELSQVMATAAENKITVLPCGNGSKLGWGKVRKSPQWIISTQKLNQIIDHAVGDLTITVQAGLKLKDLQAFLQPHKQFLPLDPTYPDSVTVGGMMATADAGNWRQRYGGVRDLVLGLSFVRWDGKIAKAGGKVVKNVAGYDLMKLFTGSYGTLGIISEITFRLYPLPDASKTFVITGESDNIASLRHKLVNTGLSPTAADILSPSVIKKLNLGDKLGFILRFQSIPESVTEQMNQVKLYADPLNLSIREFEAQSEVNLWQQLQNAILIPSQETAVTCKIGIMPNQCVNFIKELKQLTEAQGLAMINISSGIGKLQLSNEMKTSVIEKLRSLCQTYQGYLTILDAPQTLKQTIEPWGYTGNALTLMQKIKQQFDPHNLLNPNQFLI